MDWTAVTLSLRLALIVAAALLVIALPLAYWITFSPNTSFVRTRS